MSILNTSKKVAPRLLLGIARFACRHPLATAVLVAAVIVMSPPAAHAATSARQGTVVAVQSGVQTPSQRSFGYNDQSYGGSYNDRSQTRAVAGGVIGGVIGAVLGRNSNSGRYLGGAGGAAIGTAIGYNLDRRADTQRSRHEEVRQTMARQGAQIVVKLDGGETVAVFTRDVRGMYPGAKVWLIGGDELIPAN